MVFEDVEWVDQATEHMLAKHLVSVAQAEEALHDPDRVVIIPDYASRSQRSVRIIGYSESFGDLLTVIVISEHGTEYGVNGWGSNDIDRRNYREGWTR